MNGVKKCCVCKAFCKKSAKVCLGCGKTCHDKCRQDVCCRPCNSCWATRTRSCVCGRSLRILGICRNDDQPESPPKKRTKTQHKTPPIVSASSSQLDKENVCWYFSLKTRERLFKVMIRRNTWCAFRKAKRGLRLLPLLLRRHPHRKLTIKTYVGISV